MAAYPRIVRSPNKIEITLTLYGEHPRQIEVEFILDFNQFREVIGVEILNLKKEAGSNCLKRIEKSINTIGTGLRYSYDEETDSFYLQLSRESSIYQEAVLGTLILDDEGQIVSLEARWSG